MKNDEQQHRALFLNSFIKASPELGAVFLNHSGAPDRLLTDIESIDILAESVVKEKALKFITNHPLVSKVTTIPFFKMTEVWVEFHDHTAIRFRLIRSLIRKGMRCLSPKYIRESTTTNSFGMLVPSESVHFEYLVLATQFNKINLADRYRNHFTSLGFEDRSKIFGHIHSQFSLVIHVLDDLYEYSPGILFKLVLALRKRKCNSLFRILLRLIELTYFNISKRLFIKEQVYQTKNTVAQAKAKIDAPVVAADSAVS